LPRFSSTIFFMEFGKKACNALSSEIKGPIVL
jgi:hypothetical protein